jgi:hypothetical protein
MALSCCGSAWAQTLGPEFVNDYVIVDLSAIPGVPQSYGGLVFKDGDPSKLLVVGAYATPAAALYEVGVARAVSGQISGFAGTATMIASVPDADGGLRFGPGGVLFYTTYPSNTLGQLRPGSAAADRIVDLTPLGVSPSTGGLAISPNGFPGAGSLKLTSYTASAWYSGTLVPDGLGTFDVVGVTLRAVLPGTFFGSGPESAIYVQPTSTAFPSQSVLISEFNQVAVGAYTLDTNGDPVTGSRREFLETFSFSGSGSALDPLTGDFLFAEDSSSDRVIIVRSASAPLGSRYCSPAVSNSTGQAGFLMAVGSSSAAVNDVTLVASSLPSNAFGYFLNSLTPGLVIQPGGSQGTLCLGGAIGRYSAAAQIFHSGPAGIGTLVLDLASTPTPAGPTNVVPGQTWRFQAWFRDANPGPTSNFTDAVSVTFH